MLIAERHTRLQDLIARRGACDLDTLARELSVSQSTIRRDIENAGFQVVAVRGSSIPIRLIVGRFTPDFLVRAGEKILTIVTRLWLSLFAYQIVVVATPK